MVGANLGAWGYGFQTPASTAGDPGETLVAGAAGLAGQSEGEGGRKAGGSAEWQKRCGRRIAVAATGVDPLAAPLGTSLDRAEPAGSGLADAALRPGSGTVGLFLAQDAGAIGGDRKAAFRLIISGSRACAVDEVDEPCRNLGALIVLEKMARVGQPGVRLVFRAGDIADQVVLRCAAAEVARVVGGPDGQEGFRERGQRVPGVSGDARKLVDQRWKDPRAGHVDPTREGRVVPRFVCGGRSNQVIASTTSDGRKPPAFIA